MENQAENGMDNSMATGLSHLFCLVLVEPENPSQESSRTIITIVDIITTISTITIITIIITIVITTSYYY